VRRQWAIGSVILPPLNRASELFRAHADLAQDTFTQSFGLMSELRATHVSRACPGGEAISLWN